jgi:hypothetical protein
MLLVEELLTKVTTDFAEMNIVDNAIGADDVVMEGTSS